MSTVFYDFLIIFVWWKSELWWNYILMISITLFLPDYIMKLNEMSLSLFQNQNKETIFLQWKIFSFHFDCMIHCALYFSVVYWYFGFGNEFKYYSNFFSNYDNIMHLISICRQDNHFKITVQSLLKFLFKNFQKLLSNFTTFSLISMLLNSIFQRYRDLFEFFL